MMCDEAFSFAAEVPYFKRGFIALNTVSQGMDEQCKSENQDSSERFHNLTIVTKITRRWPRQLPKQAARQLWLWGNN